MWPSVITASIVWILFLMSLAAEVENHSLYAWGGSVGVGGVEVWFWAKRTSMSGSSVASSCLWSSGGTGVGLMVGGALSEFLS